MDYKLTENRDRKNDNLTVNRQQNVYYNDLS